MPCLGSTDKRLQLGPISVTEQRATVPEHEVKRHVHEEAHLVLVLHGRYLSNAEHMPSECDTPALIFNPPSTDHRDRFAPGAGRFVSIAIPQRRWQACEAKPHSLRRARRMEVGALGEALALWRQLRIDDAASRLDAEALVEALLSRAALRDAPTDARPPAWLRRAQERLDAVEAGPGRLGELARECGVHAAQLSRAFQRFVGCSPGQYLRRRQLWAVAESLANNAVVSLTDAAHQAGFFDHAHLVRALRQDGRLTPSALRKLLHLARREVA